MGRIVKTRAENLSRNKGALAPYFPAMACFVLPRVIAMLRHLLVLILLLAAARPAAAALDPVWLRQIEQLAEQAAQAALPPQGRVAIELGEPDPRLRLAPCARTEPFLPAGSRLWGRSRLGLRCVQGPVKWAISLPLQVRVFAPAWVAVQPLPAGSPLQAGQLRREVVELSASTSPAWLQDEPPLDRELARPLQAGEALRQQHLKPRQWFAAGDTVRVLLAGDGFSVRADARALSVGLEGQSSRLRLDSGRILQAWPVAERQAEVQL